MVTHTQYLFWSFAPRILSYPRLKSKAIECDAIPDGPFSTLTSRLPELASDVRILKARVANIDGALGCNALVAKTVQLVRAIPEYLAKFDVSECDAARLRREYAELAEVVAELQSQSGSQVPLGEARFLASHAGAELSQELLNDELVQLAIDEA
jgi:hypothetical protein